MGASPLAYETRITSSLVRNIARLADSWPLVKSWVSRRLLWGHEPKPKSFDGADFKAETML